MNASDVTAYVLKYKIMLQLTENLHKHVEVSVIRIMYLCLQVTTLVV